MVEPTFAMLYQFEKIYSPIWQLDELKEQLQRKSGHLIGKRLRILIAYKKYEETGISKRAVSENTGINHNDVTQKPIWHVYQKR